MDKEVILDDGKIRIWYYEEFKIVHFKFTGLAYGQDIRDGFNKGLEIVKERNVIKWLSDKGETPTFSKSDFEWSNTEWRPKMIEAGWKYWAIVEPDKASSKMLFDKIFQIYADLNVTVQMFDNFDAAFNWLKDQG